MVTPCEYLYTELSFRGKKNCLKKLDISTVSSDQLLREKQRIDLYHCAAIFVGFPAHATGDNDSSRSISSDQPILFPPSLSSLTLGWTAGKHNGSPWQRFIQCSCKPKSLDCFPIMPSFKSTEILLKLLCEENIYNSNLKGISQHLQLNLLDH